MPKPHTYTLADFLKGPLDQIFYSVACLRAVLINPGGEEDYQPGEIPESKPGLRMFLVSEKIDPDQLAATVLARIAAIQPKKFEKLLFALYLPVKQFPKFHQLLIQLRNQYPQAIIVALTCSHELRMKESALQPLLNQKIIDFVVVDEICGGAGVMTEIIKKLMELWP